MIPFSSVASVGVALAVGSGVSVGVGSVSPPSSSAVCSAVFSAGSDEPFSEISSTALAKADINTSKKTPARTQTIFTKIPIRGFGFGGGKTGSGFGTVGSGFGGTGSGPGVVGSGFGGIGSG